VLQPTTLQKPVADLGFFNGGGASASGTRIEALQEPSGMGTHVFMVMFEYVRLKEAILGWHS